LGSVSIDIHKKEREFDNLTLSDKEVVKYLILFRNKVDVGYGANTNINIYQAGDTFDFNQQIIVLYASLDKTIERASLTEKQKKIINYLYEGNTVEDVSRIVGLTRDAVYKMLDRAILKIVSANNDTWYYTAGHNGNIIKST
jgi:DNA-directed RNA polymerase specialized sigma subunit